MFAFFCNKVRVALARSLTFGNWLGLPVNGVFQNAKETSQGEVETNHNQRIIVLSKVGTISKNKKMRL